MCEIGGGNIDAARQSYESRKRRRVDPRVAGKSERVSGKGGRVRRLERRVERETQK